MAHHLIPLIFFVLSSLFSSLSHADVRPLHLGDVPQFPPCDPETQALTEIIEGKPSSQFCAKWDPFFKMRGYECCRDSASGFGSRKRGRHSYRVIQGPRRNYCQDMTPEQKGYIESVKTGKIPDVLQLIKTEVGSQGEQAFCSAHDGFLAFGRPLVPTPQNRLLLRVPELCFHFGTDPMIGMIEWLGREVARKYPTKDYSGVHLVVGDISGPRGGRLFGPSGRRRHLSHTSGQDADISFLSAKSGQASPPRFFQEFHVEQNWWMIQSILNNPFACVKVIFLDRRHKAKLARALKNDPTWKKLQRFVQHQKYHYNHFHVRIGKGPGGPGCSPNARPEQEVEIDDDDEKEDSVEASLLNYTSEGTDLEE